MKTAVGNFVIASQDGTRKGLINQLDFKGATVGVDGTTGTISFDPSTTDTSDIEASLAALEASVALLQATSEALVGMPRLSAGTNWRYDGAGNVLQFLDGGANWITPAWIKLTQWKVWALTGALLTVNPPAAATAYRVAHGMATAPRNVRVVLRCNDAGGDAGYAQDDEINMDGVDCVGGAAATITVPSPKEDHPAITVSTNATYVGIVCQIADGATVSWYAANPSDPGVFYKLTGSMWDIYVYLQ